MTSQSLPLSVRVALLILLSLILALPAVSHAAADAPSDQQLIKQLKDRYGTSAKKAVGHRIKDIDFILSELPLGIEQAESGYKFVTEQTADKEKTIRTEIENLNKLAAEKRTSLKNQIEYLEERIEELKQNIIKAKEKSKITLNGYQKQLSTEENPERKAALRETIDQIKEAIASGEHNGVNGSKELIEKSKENIERLKKELSTGSLEGLGEKLDNQHKALEQIQEAKTKNKEEYEAEVAKIKARRKKLLAEKETLRTYLDPASKNHDKTKGKKAAPADYANILELWKQKGTIEKVTEKEKQAAKKALQDFIENENSEQRSKDALTAYFAVHAGETERVKNKLTEKNPADSTPAQRIKNAAALNILGLDVKPETLPTTKSAKKMKKHLADNTEQLGKFSEPLKQTGQISRNALDQLNGPKQKQPEDLYAELDEIFGIAQDEKDISSEVKDLFTEDAPQSAKEALKKSASQFAALKNVTPPNPEKVKQKTDKSTTADEKTDDTKDPDKKDSKKEKSLERELLEAGVEKVKGKGIEKGTQLAENYAKDKIVKNLPNGKRIADGYDKVTGTYSKVTKVYDNVKKVKETVDTMNKLEKRSGTGASVFYGGAKVVGWTVAKYATGPIGTAAATTIDMGTQALEAATIAGEKVQNFSGAINHRYNNTANDFLKKVGSELPDDEGYKITLDNKDGSKKEIKVYQWKKVSTASQDYYVPQTDEGQSNHVYITIDKKAWYNPFGEDSVTVIDAKTMKPIKKYNIDL